MTNNAIPGRGAQKVAPRVVIENRQARHAYHIEDTFEAGLMLQGWEVKAILAGQANFNGGGSYIRLSNGEAFLDSMTVTPLLQMRGDLSNPREPGRSRKLLLNKTELRKLVKRQAERGYTIVPLAVTYGRILKLQIGLAKGKNVADKRDTVKTRDGKRELSRELKQAGY